MHLHWVDGPQDESETSNGREESSGLLVLACNGTTSVPCELVDNDEVGNASNSIPSPLGSVLNGESSEETGQDHDEISNNGDEDVGTCKTGQEAEIEEEEWGGNAPVDITGPVDLTLDDLLNIGDLALAVVGGNDGVVADTITDGHGEVGDGGKGGDESGQDVEQTFLLESRSYQLAVASH